MNEFKAVDRELDDILQKYFTSVFRAGYIEMRGCILPENYKALAQRIEDLVIRDDDVWVISFPKTGSTWTKEMVWLIKNNLDFEGANVSLSKRFSNLEVSATFNLSAAKLKYPEMELPDFLKSDSVTYIENLATPRFINTHLPWQLLPKQIRNGTKKPKIIYVARNAKDTCVSFYHFYKLFKMYSGNFEDFCKLFLGGTLTCGPFWPHILSFWKRHDEPNILFLKYEDLKKDLPNMIKKTATFLGKELNENQVALLSKHLSFANMKINPAVNLQSLIVEMRKYKIAAEDGQFIRSGQVDSYKEIMNQQLIEEFDHWSQANLVDTGLYF